MKKTLGKPENWQDFESLCKKLWGEIWEVQSKIKKNGRMGQPQAGVDIYAIPKGEAHYWGIQCKGKDDYSHAKLTTEEIDNEIVKALNFKPDLKVFILATTGNKDVTIEEYVRLKDLQSRKENSFEILLFCWEDIVDLIEENRDTYNYYINGNNFKSKYDFKVFLNGFESQYTIKPTFTRKIKRYKIKEKQVVKVLNEYDIFSEKFRESILAHKMPVNILNRVNYAIESFEIIMVNEGSVVIEDWRVSLTVLGEHSKLFDTVGSGALNIGHIQNKRTYCEGNRISYSPKGNEPLIQKDNRYFKAYIIPLGKTYPITIKWSLLARDYNAEGYVVLNVDPEYEDEFTYVEVEDSSELLDDEIISITEKKNYEDIVR